MMSSVIRRKKSTFIIGYISVDVRTLTILDNHTDIPPLSLNRENLPPSDIDSLYLQYGQNKNLLKEFELVSLLALSYFPELTRESIRFQYAALNSTAKTTVLFASLFKRTGRQYIIYINSSIKKTGIVLNQVPAGAQVALIAHELAHVMDFRNRSFFGMVRWGTSYLFAGHQKKIEKQADGMVITRGLGPELFNWADFVINRSSASKKYKKMKRTKYLLPEEILKYMAELKTK